MIYHLKSELTFGKHKGKTIKDIIKTDPEYLDWCLGEISTFELDDDAQDKLDEALDELGYDCDPLEGEHWGDR